MEDSDDYEAIRQTIREKVQEIYPGLVAYASNRLRLLTWRSGAPPGGQEAQDLVQETISIPYTYWVFRGSSTQIAHNCLYPIPADRTIRRPAHPAFCIG